MDAKDLSDLISQHVSVPSTFCEVAAWAQKADDVALKPLAGLYLEQERGVIVFAYLINKSGKPDALLGCMAAAKGDAYRPEEGAMAEKLPADLALNEWQQPSLGLRVEPAGFLPLVMLFPILPCVGERRQKRPDLDTHRDAFSLQVETLRCTRSEEGTVYTPEGLRESIKRRLNP